jgi:hypothetical protein
MSEHNDESIDVDMPFIHVRVRGRRVSFGGADDEVIDMERDDAGTYWKVRRRVRRQLRFFRHAFTFLAINVFLFLIDWSTGGGFWVHWVALIWGAVLAWHFVSTFIGPRLWGPDAEQRLIERELRRQRGV